MGRRKKQSPLEDMIELAAKLPWWLSLLLGGVSFIALHLYATSTEKPPTDMAGLGAFAGRQLWRIWATAGQYLVLSVFIVGGVVSLFTNRKIKQRYERTAAQGTRSALLDMTWQQFEGFVGEHFKRQGYSVTQRGGSAADGGVDVELTKDDERFLVQCKQWRATRVGVDVVRQLYGVMAARGAAGGFVVSSGAFTTDAREFVEGRNIQLIDGEDLVKRLKTSAYSSKGYAPSAAAPVVSPPAPAEAVNISCPKCSAPMVKRVARQGPRSGQSFWGCSKYPGCYGTRAM